MTVPTPTSLCNAPWDLCLYRTFLITCYRSLVFHSIAGIAPTRATLAHVRQFGHAVYLACSNARAGHCMSFSIRYTRPSFTATMSSVDVFLISVLSDTVGYTKIMSCTLSVANFYPSCHIRSQLPRVPDRDICERPKKDAVHLLHV
jgi:hypothetical protein